MNLLLVYANTHQLLWPQPAGLSLLARACQEAGHRVRLVDLLFERDPDAVLAAALAETKPDLVGLSLRNLDNADLANPVSFVGNYVRWVAQARQTAPTLIGGSAVTSAPVQLLERTGADWALAGQGEAAFPRFLEELQAGAATFTAPGLLWREAGTIRRNPPDLSGHTRGLDWSWIDRKKYERPYMARGLLTKSGCAHRCTFCDAPCTAGDHFMPREPDAIVEDLRREAREYGLNRTEYMLIDPCFNQPLPWAKALLEAIIRSGIKVRFAAVVEPTGDIDREFCRLLVRAGNTVITGLVGSYAAEVLRQTHRPFTPDTIAQAYALFEAEQVLYMPQLMFGAEGETPQTVEETLRFARRWNPIMLQAGVGVRVYPQAPLRERAVADGQIAPTDDLLDPAFYVSPGVDRRWLAERIRGLRPPRFGAAVGWARYLWRLAGLRW